MATSAYRPYKLVERKIDIPADEAIAFPWEAKIQKKGMYERIIPAGEAMSLPKEEQIQKKRMYEVLIKIAIVALIAGVAYYPAKDVYKALTGTYANGSAEYHKTK